MASGGWRLWLAAALGAVMLALAGAAPARGTAPQVPEMPAADLPPQARETIALIRKGGPYPYPRDGAFFGNFEKRLPQRERGYYREYTVRTPGAANRGARRIVAGKGGELYYTDDHYQSFKRVLESP